MSKKDFISLADHIRDNMAVFGSNCILNHHPAFMRERWLGYIRGENGPSGGTVKKGKRQ
jgi:hypothetical protein